jgi:hypothetical protein
VNKLIRNFFFFFANSQVLMCVVLINHLDVNSLDHIYFPRTFEKTLSHINLTNDKMLDKSERERDT